MVTDAESSTGPIWSDRHDSRITRFGKILRRLHIDETPQLINIIKGDMSIPIDETGIKSLKGFNSGSVTL